MNQFISLLVGVLIMAVGSTMGYYARQSMAKRDYKNIESKIEKKIIKTKEQAQKIIFDAKGKAEKIIERTNDGVNRREQEFLITKKLLLKRESLLDRKLSNLDQEKHHFSKKVSRLRELKSNIKELRENAIEQLQKISGFSKKQAMDELMLNLEKVNQKEILGKMMRLEKEGIERFEEKAKEILSLAIQRCTLNQVEEITTSTVSLPSDEIKGRIIGKEGRNIKSLEQLTGVEIIIDETPETVVISSFSPLRREVAKIALKKLISDGRIQPVRIEKEVENAKKQINAQIKKVGEQAVYDLGILDFDPKLVQLLGRLSFRRSYSQNVLLHSIEVAYLASALAQEVGANVLVCKKAGLLHDIGKAVDYQIEGSHVDIGIKILEKFKVDKEIITAMKAHHEDYDYDSLESILVQVADQISGARPGARKDTLENYLKRLSELEEIATSFDGVKKAWALQAGREIRVFVKAGEVDDLKAKKIAIEIANRIHEELSYPGEIKVNVIREVRAIEYAK